MTATIADATASGAATTRSSGWPLRVHRPARVRCLSDGRWGWSCWLCPRPLCDHITPGQSWSLAQDDAVEHVRHCHNRTKHVDADGRPARGWLA